MAVNFQHPAFGSIIDNTLAWSFSDIENPSSTNIVGLGITINAATISNNSDFGKSSSIVQLPIEALALDKEGNNTHHVLDNSTASNLNTFPPIDLKTLRLSVIVSSSNEEPSFEWIDHLDNLYNSKVICSQLRQVQLYFNSTLHCFLQDLFEEQNESWALVEMLERWESSGICLESFFFRANSISPVNGEDLSYYVQKPLLEAMKALRDGLPELTEVLAEESQVNMTEMHNSYRMVPSEDNDIL